MRDATDVLRIVGMILLGIFVFAVGFPIVLTAAGITFGLIKILFGIAVLVIKLAVVIAIAYLILVGVRAVLRSTEEASEPLTEFLHSFCPIYLSCRHTAIVNLYRDVLDLQRSQTSDHASLELISVFIV